MKLSTGVLNTFVISMLITVPLIASAEEKPSSPAVSAEPAVAIATVNTQKPLSSDRPMRTLPSVLVGKWVVQFESGFDFATYRNNGVRTKLLGGAPTKVRLGIHDSIEVFVQTDAFVYDTVEKNNSTSTTYGFADIAVGLKFNFTKGGAWHGLEPAATLHVSLQMPVGSSGFTLDTWSPKAVLSFTWKIPGGIDGRVNIGSQLLSDKNTNKYHEGVYGVGFLRNWAPLTDKVGNFVEVYGGLPFGDAAVFTSAANAGFFFMVDPNFRVDLSCRAKLYGDGPEAPEVAGGIGFTIRL